MGANTIAAPTSPFSHMNMSSTSCALATIPANEKKNKDRSLWSLSRFAQWRQEGGVSRAIFFGLG